MLFGLVFGSLKDEEVNKQIEDVVFLDDDGLIEQAYDKEDV